MAITFTRFANTDVLGPTIFNRLGDELVQDIEDVLDGTEAMASPAVTSFVQSQHNHQNGAGGAQLSAAAMSASGITDNWVLSALSGQAQWADANIGGVPAGGGALWFGSASPSGWLLCDGRTVNRQSFSALFNAIGTQYNTGGESSSDFRLPDTRGRVLMGLDNMGGTSANRVTATVADTLGGSGGAESHTLLTGSAVGRIKHRPWAASEVDATSYGRYPEEGPGHSHLPLSDWGPQSYLATYW